MNLMKSMRLPIRSNLNTNFPRNIQYIFIPFQHRTNFHYCFTLCSLLFSFSWGYFCFLSFLSFTLISISFHRTKHTHTYHTHTYTHPMWKHSQINFQKIIFNFVRSTDIWNVYDKMSIRYVHTRFHNQLHVEDFQRFVYGNETKTK